MNKKKWSIVLVATTTLILTVTPAASRASDLNWAVHHTMVDGNMSGSQTIETADGGFLVSGTGTYDSPSGYHDWGHYLAKFDSAGNLQGDRLLDHRPAVAVHEIRFFNITLGYYLLSHGEAVFCQNDACYITHAISLTRIDALGELVWTKTYGYKPVAMYPAAMVVDHQGITIAGTLRWNGDKPDATDDIWAMRVDLNGHLVWHNRYDLGDHESNVSLAKVGTHGYVLAGDWSYLAELNNIWVMEIDNNGLVGQRREFETGKADWANDIVVADATKGAEQYILVGQNYLEDNYSGNGALVMRFDMNHENPPIWAKMYNVESGDRPSDQARAALLYEITPGTTELVVVGSSEIASSADSIDGLVMRLDPSDGKLKWHRHWGGEDHEWLVDVQLTASGNFLVSGESIDDQTWDSRLWAMALSPQGLPYVTDFCWVGDHEMETSALTVTSSEPTVTWSPQALRVEEKALSFFDPNAQITPMCEFQFPLP